VALAGEGHPSLPLSEHVCCQNDRGVEPHGILELLVCEIVLAVQIEMLPRPHRAMAYGKHYSLPAFLGISFCDLFGNNPTTTFDIDTRTFSLNLLSAPLTIPLIYCYIKSFQRASSGGEAMTRRRKEDRRAGLASRGI
jgi:hypothetical protein